MNSTIAATGPNTQILSSQETTPRDLAAIASHTHPFAFGHKLYSDAGWQGVIRLPRLAKKHPPAGFTGYSGQWPTEQQFTQWADEEGGTGNIGLRLPRNVIGIDVDQYVKEGRQKRGAEQFAALAEKYGPLPPTWSSTRREPDGPSRIYLFRVPEGTELENKPGDDIEAIQFHHRYAVVWPSVVPDDNDPNEYLQYAWYDLDGNPSDRVPTPGELAELPEAWVKGLRHQSGRRNAPSLAQRIALPPDDPGRGNDWLVSVAGGLAKITKTRDEYIQAVRAIDQGSVNPQAPEVVDSIAVRIWEKEHGNTHQSPKGVATKQELDLQPSHLDVARAFERNYGEGLRHTPGLGWLVWDGHRWRRNEKKPRQLAHAVTDDLIGRVPTLAGGNASAAMGWQSFLLDKCRSNVGINSIVSVASSLERLHVDEEEIDADPYKLLVGNGVVDLKTGHLLPNDPSYLLMHGTAVDYDPIAECPMWEDFLGWAFQGNVAMIEYTQDMFGEILIGKNRHQVAFFLYGPARSGKSTVANVASRLVGDYAAQSDLSVFNESNNGHNDALARLANKRLAVFSETQQGRSINESTFKKFTGERTMDASFKGKTGFEFEVKFTPLITGNNRPAIHFDSGVKRRMKVITMNNFIPDNDQDPDLVDKMFANEGAGIMAWAVRGAVRMASAKAMQDPPEVTQAVAEYAAENDHLGQFIDEMLVFDPGVFMRSSDLWEIYRKWIEGGGKDFVKTEGKAGLTKAIHDRAVRDDLPFETRKKVKGNWGVRGITPRTTRHDDE